MVAENLWQQEPETTADQQSQEWKRILLSGSFLFMHSETYPMDTHLRYDF